MFTEISRTELAPSEAARKRPSMPEHESTYCTVPFGVCELEGDTVLGHAWQARESFFKEHALNSR
jgi:hypothetical protein